MSAFVPQGMGWQPEIPDARDYTYRHPEVLPLLQRLNPSKRKMLPDAVDLRRDGEVDHFTQPKDQGPINSSSAFAVLSLVEYFERRIRGCVFEGSELFLHKVTRNRIARQLPVAGNGGTDLRTTLKVLVQFGVPPAEYWPYEIDKCNDEPTAFVYGLAKPFSDLRYFHLDEPNSNGETTWTTLKSFLAAGFPVLFGFSVPSSISTEANIPYRRDYDSPRGGQVVVAVGYKNNHFGPRQDAVLVRSSWGRQWGANGNGWLHVAFIRNQIARDFWTVVREGWLDSGELSQPSILETAEPTGKRAGKT